MRLNCNLTKECERNVSKIKQNDYSQLKKEHDFLDKILVDFEIPTGVRYVVKGNVSMSPAKDRDLRTGQELLSDLILSEKIGMATKNGEPIKKLDKDCDEETAAEGLSQDAVMAFVNDDEQVIFHEACSEVRNWKEQFQSYTYTAGARRIRDIAVNRWGEIAKLEALSKSGNAYYGGAEVTLLLSPKGQVLTDIDAFYIQALADEDKKNSIVYCSAYTQEYLNELDD